MPGPAPEHFSYFHFSAPMFLSISASKETRLISGGFECQLFIADLGGHAALRSALQVTPHDQVRLVDFFQRVRFLSHRDRQRTQAYRAAGKFRDDRLQNALIHFVEPIFVDFQNRERLVRNASANSSVTADLSKVAYPAEQIICDAWRSAAAPGDLKRAALLNFYVQQTGGANHDLLQVFGIVIVQPLAHRKTRKQRSSQQTAARRGADQGKAWQLEADTASVRSLIDDDIEFEIFHRRIKIFLDSFLQPVNLIDKEDIALLQIGQQTGEIARFFDGRPTGGLDIRAHGLCDNIGQGRFSETRRAAQQNMVNRFAALFGRGDGDLYPLFDLGLSREF